VAGTRRDHPLGGIGLANATFWRHYRDIATELRHHDARARQAVPAPDQSQRPGQVGELASQNAALRRERDTSPASSKQPSATCGG
jgi:hypothetical protein